MNLRPVYAAWASSPFQIRVCLICIAVLLSVLAVDLGARTWEHIRDAGFDQREAEHETRIRDLDLKIDQLRSRAERAEAKAEVVEQKAEALAALSEEQGARAKAEAKKLDEAFAMYEQDSEISGADVAEDVRRERICRKRKELGYPCGR